MFLKYRLIDSLGKFESRLVLYLLQNLVTIMLVKSFIRDLLLSPSVFIIYSFLLCTSALRLLGRFAAEHKHTTTAGRLVCGLYTSNIDYKA